MNGKTQNIDNSEIQKGLQTFSIIRMTENKDKNKQINKLSSELDTNYKVFKYTILVVFMESLYSLSFSKIPNPHRIEMLNFGAKKDGTHLMAGCGNVCKFDIVMHFAQCIRH